MNKIAQNFYDTYRLIAISREEFGEEAPRPIEIFRTYYQDIGSSKKTCPQSCDSTIAVTFRDGSKCEITNPNEEVYDSHIRLF